MVRPVMEPEAPVDSFEILLGNFDGLVKSRHSGEACPGMPKSGNRSPENFEVFETTGFRRLPRTRSGVRRNDGNTSFQTFYEKINFGI